MPAREPTGPGSESLGFAEAVHQYIAPLLTDKGFVCTEQTPRIVRFLSPTIGLSVYHEPYSYEIGIEYALRATPEERFGLSDLLDAAVGPEHRKQAFLQASTHDRVVASMMTIVGYLQKHGEAVLMGDVAAHQRVLEAARRWRDAHTKQVLQQPIREAAEAAWSKHDYAAARNLYETIEQDLTSIEQSRLNYAKLHARSDRNESGADPA